MLMIYKEDSISKLMQKERFAYLVLTSSLKEEMSFKIGVTSKGTDLYFD